MSFKIMAKEDVKLPKGITLIALVITIIVLLILAGVTINMILGDEGIIAQTEEAQLESRGGTVEEKRNKWELENKLKNKYGASGNVQELEELLQELEENKLITEDERKQIEETGEVTIGSRKINFNIGQGTYEGAVMDLFEVAMSYFVNKNNLIYGETQTAYDLTKSNHMDCSAFIQLVLEGVPYEQSVYKNSSNTSLAYGYKFPENPYVAERATLGGGYDVNAINRWYAHEIGRYADEKGYTFEINSDYSNLKPGDIVFYDFSPYGNYQKYKSIDHVAIVVGSVDGESLTVLHSNNSGDLVKFYTYSSEYVPVLAARFPIKGNTEIEERGEDLITNDKAPKTSTNGTLWTYDIGDEISESLDSNTSYTFICKVDYTEEDTALYVGLQVNYEDGGQEIIGRYKGCPIPEDGTYVFRFKTSKQIKNLKPMILGEDEHDKSAKIEWADLYKGLCLSEY